jgi:hypothetical protein
MAESNVTNSFITAIALLFAGAFAIGVFYLSVISSFRIADLTFGEAWELNFHRTAITFSAGFALVIGFASNSVQLPVAKHISSYIALVLFSAGLMLGQTLSWPIIISILSGVSFGAFGFWSTEKLEVNSPLKNLLLGFVLYAVFVTSVVVYLTAVGFTDGFSGIVLWLFSDASQGGNNGYIALACVFLAALWLVYSQRKQALSLIMLGLSLGLLGPIMFIGFLIPYYVQGLDLEQKKHMLVSGLVGGAILTTISTVSSMALGGYSPALMIPISFISIPLLLWLSRSPHKSALGSISETLLILLSMVMSAGVIWHLAAFVQIQA